VGGIKAMSRKYPKKWHYLKKLTDGGRYSFLYRNSSGVSTEAKKGDIIKMPHGIYQNRLNQWGDGFKNYYQEITEEEYKLANIGK
jgi:hypothetical protein